VLAVSDFDKAQAELRRLLGNPAPVSIWRAGTGPAIRLVSGNTTRIQTLSLKVEAIDRARYFLKKMQLLGSAAAEEISLKPSRVQGLGIRLVEE
jgi:hypothetical protein